jgi:hypothetical protein
VTVDASDVHRSDPITSPAGPWWRRTGLDAIGGRLVIAGSDAEARAGEAGDLFAED